MTDKEKIEWACSACENECRTYNSSKMRPHRCPYFTEGKSSWRRAESERPVVDPDIIPAGEFEFGGRTLKYPVFSMRAEIERWRLRNALCEFVLSNRSKCDLYCGGCLLRGWHAGSGDEFGYRAFAAFCAQRGITLDADKPAVPDWLKIGAFAVIDGKAIKVERVEGDVVEGKTREGHRIAGTVSQFKEAKVRPWTYQEVLSYVGKPITLVTGPAILILGARPSGHVMVALYERLIPLRQLLDCGATVGGWPCGEVEEAQ